MRMSTGTILVAIAFLCCFSGCTKKPTPKRSTSAGKHQIEIEMGKQVMVDKETTATATWKGGTPPFEIVWYFQNTIEPTVEREATSPDTITFVIPTRNAKIGHRYTISASITDADGQVSTAYQPFIFSNNPLKSNSGMFREVSE